MDVAPNPARAAAPDPAPNRILCAYSPTWLSGPTPGYEGLCPSWDVEVAPRRDQRDPSLV